MFVKIS